MSSAGIKDSARRSRIKKKAVRPPVAPRNMLNAQVLEEKVESEIKQEVVAEVVEPTNKPSVTIVTNDKEVLEAESKKSKPKVSKAKKKEKRKGGGHFLPRYEVRLNGDHPKLINDILAKAFKEVHPANKGINNGELFGGLLEFVRPFIKKLKFSSIDFKRGKLYGDGTEKIKVEVGKNIERGAFQFIMEELEKGEGNRFKDVIDTFSDDQKQKIISELDNLMSDSQTSSKIAANS